MSVETLLTATKENDLYFQQFKRGEEKALTYIHKHTHALLAWHGRQLITDPFVVSCMVQEALLKAWTRRDRIQSLLHVYRFMRLNVTWGCKGWLKQPGNAFHRQRVYYTDNISIHESLLQCTAQEMQEEAHAYDEERIQLLEKVIPYLSPDRQTIMQLYFKHGLNYKSISRRFAVHPMAIHAEVQKGLEQLKKMVRQQKKRATHSNTTLQFVTPAGEMDAEMVCIFQLRYELKMGFSGIAEKMNLEQTYVQQQYIKAHALLHSMKMTG